MSSLTVKDLTKAFTTTPVLTGVDLHVPSGSFTALLGPSVIADTRAYVNVQAQISCNCIQY